MVILQAFYWDYPPRLWKDIEVLAPTIAEKGFDEVWLPPPSLGMAGDLSMGYDIKDHYNLNSRFGNGEELKKAIEELHKSGLSVMADLVLGHMLGGKKEYNPVTKKDTYTKFDSDKFPKNYKHFCRNCGNCNSDNEFGETICYYSDNDYMKNGLIKWAEWLKYEIGFDSFRLDNLKDIRWDFTREFKDHFENTFMVGEYWSGADKYLKTLINYADINLFNFPLFYKLKEMCMNPNFPLNELSFISKEHKVNFVSNHDLERHEPIVNKKELAYAYILFQNEPAVVFWKDYFEYELKDKIDELLRIRKETSNMEEIKTTDDLYVAQRGNYKLYINNSLNETEDIPPRSYKIKGGK